MVPTADDDLPAAIALSELNPPSSSEQASSKQSTLESGTLDESADAADTEGEES